MTLNEKQHEAVNYIDGPILILAGAGSGKTRVLTERIAVMIEKGIDPFSIVAITFTNKAAKEMKERIGKRIGGIHYQIQISTFHSFGVRLIRENYELLGLNKNFSILDSEDVLSVIKKILKDFNYDIKEYNPRAIRNKISSAKNEFILEDDYGKFANSEFEKVVWKVYREYQATLYKNSLVDFDDLLILPIILFKENPHILDYYQEKFKYLLVDEYQDTNEAQYILIKMLASKYRNICVVGDNDQSIYSFRGANYKNILNFEKDYKEAHTVFLEENYRSTNNILKAANDVIKNNKERKDKNLWSNNGDGDLIRYVRCDNEKTEASYVINKIKELHDKGINYSDIVILYRTNAQSRVFEEELLKTLIPYKVVGSFYFYARKEIKDLIMYLRLIHNQSDDVSLIRAINSPKRGIGEKSVVSLANKASEKNISMYDAIDSGKELIFKNIIGDLIKFYESSSLVELIEEVLEKSGLRDELKKEKTMEADIRIENLEEFKSIAKNFEDRTSLVSLEDFLMEITLVSDTTDHEAETDKLNLMTVHSAKGLEFHTVFIAGLEEGIFPHINSLMEKSELEEERRLCYVAITRARNNLYILNAKRRLLFGNPASNPPSRFINEISDSYIENDSKITNVDFDEDYYSDDNDIDYEVGDTVIHDTYGEGIVTKVDKSTLNIAFYLPHGFKTLIKSHKYLKKV